MTEPDRQPDYAELLQSPYDPPPEDDTAGSDQPLPWVPSVIAAVIGALVVSAFVIYAVATDPEEDAAADTTAPVEQSEPVASAGLPPGYVGVTDSVGARIEQADFDVAETIVAVSTAVPGDRDSDEVPPLDPAYWSLRRGEDEIPMTGQLAQRGVLGNYTIQFPPLDQVEGLALVPHLPGGEAIIETSVETDTEIPQTIEGVVIDLGDGRSVVIDKVVVGDGWGWVSWSTTGGAVARVDTIVTFEGTDDPSTEDTVDPTRLVPEHLRPMTQGGGVVPLPPLYGFSGSSQLIRSGRSIGAGNEPTGITVRFTVTAPSSVVPGPELPLPAVPETDR
ncbi:MAG: hypothetical protein QNJ71_05200 [Acidimicrobiia bacterium]|nr:hypothetical protein [Acidimicrobiia bacterium]